MPFSESYSALISVPEELKPVMSFTLVSSDSPAGFIPEANNVALDSASTTENSA